MPNRQRDSQRDTGDRAERHDPPPDEPEWPAHVR